MQHSDSFIYNNATYLSLQGAPWMYIEKFQSMSLEELQ